MPYTCYTLRISDASCTCSCCGLCFMCLSPSAYTVYLLFLIFFILNNVFKFSKTFLSSYLPFQSIPGTAATSLCIKVPLRSSHSIRLIHYNATCRFTGLVVTVSALSFQDQVCVLRRHGWPFNSLSHRGCYHGSDWLPHRHLPLLNISFPTMKGAIYFL